jgi:hypothetical protein
LKDTSRGGRRVTAATFKVGIKVRTSGVGARLEADSAPGGGAHLPACSILDEGACHTTGKTRPTGRRRPAGRGVNTRAEAVVALAARGYGNEVERIEFYKEHEVKKERSIDCRDLEYLSHLFFQRKPSA